MRIHIDDDFDLGKIAASGQCFRAKEVSDGVYRYITGDSLLYIKAFGDDDFEISCDMETWENVWADYFDLGRDYSAIRSSCEGKHSFVDESMTYGKGLRILHQDPWEMVVSFIISQRKSIPAISTAVEALCKSYGHVLTVQEENYPDASVQNTESADIIYDTVYSFPTARELSAATDEGLRACSLGYRAPYVLDAIEKVNSGSLDLDGIRTLPDEELLESLKEVHGIGKKVANCIALFGYERLSCVPVDVWIARAIEEEFEGEFPYDLFGDVSGIIQQYIFFYEKNR